MSILPAADWIWPFLLTPVAGGVLSFPVTIQPIDLRCGVGEAGRTPNGSVTAVAWSVPPVYRRLVSPLRIGSSPRYALTVLDLTLGAMAVAGWAEFATQGWLIWASCALGWFLVALALADLRHFLLPDLLTVPLGMVGLGVTWMMAPSALADHLLAAALGGGTFLLTRAAYFRLREREGLGMGDVKLMAALGAWLGCAALPSVVLIAALAGLALALPRLVLASGTRAEPRLPFGAYLALGAWLVWLYGPVAVG